MNIDYPSHMPFLTRSPSGDRVLFFCRPVEMGADPVVWKMFVQCGDQEPFRLGTGFSDRTIECSPAAWHDDTGWHVSFVAGGGPDDPAYHLYRMDGISLQRLSPPVAMKLTRIGFVYRNRLVSGDKMGNIYVYDRESDLVLELPRMELLRLSYMAEEPDVLLISCRWPEEDNFCTVAYNLATSEQFFVEAGGVGVYKPTILEDEYLHAVRVGEDFEERQIRSEIGEENWSFRATATYAAGPIKNDNMGAASPDGAIGAGSTSSGNVVYSGKRNMFCDVDTDAQAPITELVKKTNPTITMRRRMNERFYDYEPR